VYHYQDVLFRESFDVLVGSLFDLLANPPETNGKQVMSCHIIDSYPFYATMTFATRGNVCITSTCQADLFGNFVMRVDHALVLYRA
jgi:hypothetical protein